MEDLVGEHVWASLEAHFCQLDQGSFYAYLSSLISVNFIDAAFLPTPAPHDGLEYRSMPPVHTSMKNVRSTS